MKRTVCTIFGIFSMVLAILVSLVGVAGIFLYIIPSLGRTYYAMNLYARFLAAIAASAGFWLLCIWLLKYAKGMNKKGLLFASLVLLAMYVLYRFPLHNLPNTLIEKGVGFQQVKEITYNVHGFEYTIPASWVSNTPESGDGWESRVHFPFTNIDANDGNFYVYGFDHEFTDNDFTGDYRSFLTSWYSENENYRIIDTNYIRNEKYDIAALVQESTSSYEGHDFHDLTYVVEDRENGKVYLMQYRKFNGITAQDRANFEVIINHLE